MSWMDFDPVEMVQRWRRPRCNDGGACLLRRDHQGFHKAANRIWPNESDSPEYWIGIRRHLLTVGPLPHLSLNEIRYAMEFDPDREDAPT